jgi:type II secretory pathway component PulF
MYHKDSRMPHFRWRGVTIDGSWRSGRQSALSAEALDRMLFARGVACTRLRSYRPLFKKRVADLPQQAYILESIALLLESGVRLPEAWHTISNYVENPHVQELVIRIATALEQGASLHECFVKYPVFGEFIRQLIIAGYDAGSIAHSMRIAARYVTQLAVTFKQLRAALMMPCITIVFVLGLLWTIIIFLVPVMATMFSHMDTNLPATMLYLLTVSDYVRNPIVLLLCMGILCLSIFSIRMGIRKAQKAYWLYIPILGSLYMQWQRIIFLQSYGALLQGGMRVPEALMVMRDTTSVPFVRAYLQTVWRAVDSGMMLSDAMATIDARFFTPSLVALVVVGQESNNIVHAFVTIAQQEYEQFVHALNRYTVLVQPLLILLLGLVVLTIISVLYGPLLHMAHAVQV